MNDHDEAHLYDDDHRPEWVRPVAKGSALNRKMTRDELLVIDAALVEEVRGHRAANELDRKRTLLRGYGEDEFGDDTVFTFTKSFGPGAREYRYAVIKAAGKWWLTGDAGSVPGRSWDDLVLWLVSGEDAVSRDRLVRMIRETTTQS